MALHSSTSVLSLLILLTTASSIKFRHKGKTYDFSKVPKTIRLDVFYESLCPYSIGFITTQLWPTYLLVGYHMDVNLVPFGNAFEEERPNTDEHRRDANWPKATPSYSCQHGPDECFGNVVQACAAQIFNDTLVTLAFVTCMSTANEPAKVGKLCANGVAHNWEKIERCATGLKGIELQERMSKATWSLDPPHSYVPWVLVNGAHTDEQQAMAQSNLLQLVCDSLPADKKPPACFDDEPFKAIQSLTNTIENRDQNAINEYKERNEHKEHGNP
ncbi:gamma-interferon-inducible lysosomal thiol reductase-like [Ixodes scapularis]|uniref:Gamma-interferon inducible lysosomal thiol reductase, putative n=1 Tax=Ixodes scapularis TaxID=6945 RepID=B7PFX8_IXOSC|nr:gamma-interferon-inducible lysosomal thiol reductase-like [Ixodes scapularis]EEC05500.1 gamma-interferon inducible lysosomal thiol reductase, putative [Ixodes scapularis]|eukprot:XP_002434100.1 gamma-interferon inducible lysosomal thiol reductase, putative [Ixodes scapularis]